MPEPEPPQGPPETPAQSALKQPADKGEAGEPDTGPENRDFTLVFSLYVHPKLGYRWNVPKSGGLSAAALHFFLENIQLELLDATFNPPAPPLAMPPGYVPPSARKPLILKP